MSLGVEKLLPSDCLNINEFGRYTLILIPMHMNIQELLLKFHNFGGEYQIAIEFAC